MTSAMSTVVASFPALDRLERLLDKLEVLFEPSLKIDPLDLIERMSETYGEREGAYRMTNMVIQSQAGWGAVERVEKGKRVIRLAPAVVEDDALTAWLIEAALRYASKPLTTASLQSQPALFPFKMTQSLTYLVSNSEHLTVRVEGTGNRFVALREAV
ncbi:MAG: hypothetical protein LBR95_07040 [Azoarcus sp.]|jgi:hypothetical protein|nr:hypothetical protein [Azoarcus sp.]